MLFISVFYLLFLGLTAAVFYFLPHKFRPLWLLATSYFFYLSWQPAFVVVLIFETLTAFFLGQKINAATDQTQRKFWLTASVCLLLVPLIFFKYFNFLNNNLTGILAVFNFENSLPNQPYLVPLGISFFTFQSISYIADVYRGYLKPEKRIEKFAVYMAFFPYILAGPIERTKSILQQISEPVSFEYQNIRAGLQLILWGVFKKVVIADRLKDFMDAVYAAPNDFQGILIYFALAFSVFQMFCDFSAYSDIAVGSARMFGINLTKNFDDRVYAAPSRRTFWQGWHRSLTAWLRDYVFFPLSRNVKKQSRLYLNLVLIYLLVGIWHGATWGFVVWGFLNGIWLVLEHWTEKRRGAFFSRLGFDVNGRVYNFFGWLLVFHVGALFGVFFRTDSPEKAFNFLANILNSNTNLLGVPEARSCLIAIIFIGLMDMINRQIPANKNFDEFIGKQKTWLRWSIYIVLAEAILRYIHVFENNRFAYFNY